MTLIAIEEHWMLPELTSALKAVPRPDESLAFNEHGDTLQRLEDLGAGRIAAMDAQGIDLARPRPDPARNALRCLPSGQSTSAALANDTATEAVQRPPGTVPVPVDPADVLPATCRRRARTGRSPGPRGHHGLRPIRRPASRRPRLRRLLRHRRRPWPARLHPSPDPLRPPARRHLPGLRPTHRPRPRHVRLGLAPGSGHRRPAADPARHLRPAPRAADRPWALGRAAAVLARPGRQPRAPRRSPAHGLRLHPCRTSSSPSRACSTRPCCTTP